MNVVFCQLGFEKVWIMIHSCDRYLEMTNGVMKLPKVHEFLDLNMTANYFMPGGCQ